MSECITSKTDAKCVCQENGRSVSFLNRDKNPFEHGIVDGCLIADSRERCDFFVRIPDKIWLVELKGRNVKKAVSQIISTMKELDSEIGERACVPVIITSGCPAIAGQQKQLLLFKALGKKIPTEIVLRTNSATIALCSTTKQA